MKVFGSSVSLLAILTGRLRGGGTEDPRAWRTTRRWTP